jgi:hypothetical protein
MQGLLLHGLITPASVQDRDGGIALLSTLFGMFPFLKKLFADSAYQGPQFHTALASILPNLETEIVKRSDAAKGFVALSNGHNPRGTVAPQSPSQIFMRDYIYPDSLRGREKGLNFSAGGIRMAA